MSACPVSSWREMASFPLREWKETLALPTLFSRVREPPAAGDVLGCISLVIFAFRQSQVCKSILIKPVKEESRICLFLKCFLPPTFNVDMCARAVTEPFCKARSHRFQAFLAWFVNPCTEHL